MTIKVRTANPIEIPLSTGPCVSATEETMMDAEYSLQMASEENALWTVSSNELAFSLSRSLTRNETEFTFFSAARSQGLGDALWGSLTYKKDGPAK